MAYEVKRTRAEEGNKQKILRHIKELAEKLYKNVSLGDPRDGAGRAWVGALVGLSSLRKLLLGLILVVCDPVLPCAVTCGRAPANVRRSVWPGVSCSQEWDSSVSGGLGIMHSMPLLQSSNCARLIQGRPVKVL